MGVLLPTLQAERIREGLTDYLATTFALTDADAREALEEFISDPEIGMFKGPYVRLRLPFAPARGGWREHLDWYAGFPPYAHQAAAFRRLSSKNGRPQPTIVTTGTGSGKTEAFLMPILDHVLRARREGIRGTKALILYPMNALANDQASRLATLLTTYDDLGAVTAALYTGEQGNATMVTESGLITDRFAIREEAPDILLTNYKMLDALLLRSEDAPLWDQSAESLQYVVLDEFHTYDGAQGTDVAMLLRRLGLSLKRRRRDDSTVTDAERARPLGRITPVATSATLGDQDDSTQMRDFAAKVFGEEFAPDAAIGETRLSVAEWVEGGPLLPTSVHEVQPNPAEALAGVRKAAGTSDRELVGTVVKQLFREVDTDSAEAELADRTLRSLLAEDLGLPILRRHSLIRRLLDETSDATSLADVAVHLFPTADRADSESYLRFLLAALSIVRFEAGRDAVGIDTHLWLRELSRIDRAVGTVGFRWSDDGVSTDLEQPYFPALFCRFCGRSGWGVVLAPTGLSLELDDSAIRAMPRSPRFRALISAASEGDLALDGGQCVEGLCWLHPGHRELRRAADARADEADLEAGRLVPVLASLDADAEEHATRDTCPSCRREDGIRFLGSAIATQLSVTLSNLFGDPDLDEQEKKALVFTDSVQDAAHRAGFVQQRSHQFTLRTALRRSLQRDLISLPDLVEFVIDDNLASAQSRYQLLDPAIVDLERFVAFWDDHADRARRTRARRYVRQRLLLDVTLEFGLRARLGRTLELTGSAVAEVALGEAPAVARYGRTALDNINDSLPGLTGPRDDLTMRHWVRGVVERIRLQGSVSHPWWDPYIDENGRRWAIWGGRKFAEGMPPFPAGAPAPAFPAYGGTGPHATGRGAFDPMTSPQGWYARWAAACLGISPHDGAHAAKALIQALHQAQILTTRVSGNGATTYALHNTHILVAAPDSDDLAAGLHLLSCDTCQGRVPGSARTIDDLDAGACLTLGCPGTLRRAAVGRNFYQDLFSSTQMRRVVAREHTSLLDADLRQQYEREFRESSTNPRAPNVLVATPTLEMGIDIGDLSTVLLASLPRRVASYLQRVGRAGRLTGSALSVAYVRGRGEQLPKIHDPLSTIQGEVRPPAVFLDAAEILQRQFVASLIDVLAADPSRTTPRRATAALGTLGEKDGFLDRLLTLAQDPTHLKAFLDQFDRVLTDDARAALVAWASPPTNGTVSGLDRRVRDAASAWAHDLAELEGRRAGADQAARDLEPRADSPAATDDDQRDLRAARSTVHVLAKRLERLRGEYWISVLELYGLLPNYTLLDDTTTLAVSLTWFDTDTGQWNHDSRDIRRASRRAITEFAPGNTFYAQGLEIAIDAIDLGADGSAIETWQVCPQCGWVDRHVANEQPAFVAICPRCGRRGIDDIRQRLDVVELRDVSAQVRRDVHRISDRTDDRRSERYERVAAADFDPQDTEPAWYVGGLDFGAQYLRRVQVRWLNLGPVGSSGPSRDIAGTEVTTGLFRVCGVCGRLDRSAGNNTRSEHQPWCSLRDALEEQVRTIALSRSLTTQGLLIRIPAALEIDTFGIPSLSAAIRLGMREELGGSPEHLDIEVVPDPKTGLRALLVLDTVPGGTGYLAGLAGPDAVRSVLDRAREVLEECPCQSESREACHRCLLPFVSTAYAEMASRVAALRALRDLEPEWTVVHGPPHACADQDGRSALESAFYTSFIERLRVSGARVTERPGSDGNSATIVVPGSPTRKWKLTPEQSYEFTRPDFELYCEDTSIPRVLVYADGRQFHASDDHNRVADDADKRRRLREMGHVVWAFTFADLDDFRDGSRPEQPWLDARGLTVLKQRFGALPTVVDLLERDPITQLLNFVLRPDVEAWRTVGRHLPYTLRPASLAAKSSITDQGDAVRRALAGADDALSAGDDPSWLYRQGGLALAAGVAAGSRTRVPAAVLAVDDEPAALAASPQSWRTYLRLANWLGLSERSTITTRRVLDVSTTIVPFEMEPTAAPQLSPEWVQLRGEALDEEVELLDKLAALGHVEPPTLGHELGDGEVLDLAWPDRQAGVALEPDEGLADRLKALGWTLLAPDAAIIADALRKEG